ncbi:MAG: FG-GAP-like repeat-containing protein [Steroidobacteraceae bacterium]
MAFESSTAVRAASAVCGLCCLLTLAACEGAFGTSPPHAAPPNPAAEGRDGQIELSWGAVEDATRYVILWSDGTTPGVSFNNEITDITETSFTHTGLVNQRTYRYRIVATTSGGRGPESVPVSAEPGPVPGPVEWVAVTSQNPGHTIHFAEAENATGYRVFIAATEAALAGRRPAASFVDTDRPPLVRPGIAVTASAFYRVIALNDERIGGGGPVAVSTTSVISEHNLPEAGAAFGDPNDDDCLDLPTAAGTVEQEICLGSFLARVLPTAGLADLLATGRKTGDSRFADFTGDGFDDLFSNTSSPAGDSASVALFHVNQGNGNYQTSAGVTALGIGGFGGTLLAADFDNDGDVDVFAPNDHTQGDGARNWLLMNGGGGIFTDSAAAAGVDANPAGAAFVPRGGQAADFNEDGHVDLLFGSRLLINDGDGTFSDGSAAAGMPVLADRGLKLIDVDLDGDLDLLHHYADTRLYRNESGVFDAGTVISHDSVPSFGFGINACDINGDGFEDVVIANNALATHRGAPKILVNTGGILRFSATQRGIPADPDSLLSRNDTPACGDVNDDGMSDVLMRWGLTYRVLRGAATLSKRIRVRVLGGGGERNQQGRIVRVVPRNFADRIMTRVIESGSGLQSQNQYDLLFGAPWPGSYDVTVGFAAGDVTTTAEAGDDLAIFADGRIEDLTPEEP